MQNKTSFEARRLLQKFKLDAIYKGAEEAVAPCKIGFINDFIGAVKQPFILPGPILPI